MMKNGEVSGRCPPLGGSVVTLSMCMPETSQESIEMTSIPYPEVKIEPRALAA